MAEPDLIERRECPACLNNSFESIYALPEGSEIINKYLSEFYREQGGVDLTLLGGWKYELIKCVNCSLIFQKYILGNRLMHVLYEQWINAEVTFKMSKKHPLTYHLNLFEEVAQMITYFGKQPNELNFLDFGMGWAEWCKVATALGVNAFGAELSEARIVNAQKNNIEIVDIENVEENKFDCINTEQVFEHISNPLHTLRKLYLLVRPGGLIKISVPDGYLLPELLKINDWNAPKGTAHSLNAVAPLEHINCFTFQSLFSMGQAAGLVLEPKLSYRKYLVTPQDILKNKFRYWYINKLRPNKGTYLFFRKPA